MYMRCFKSALQRPSLVHPAFRAIQLYSTTLSAQKTSEPLRILFCGSDDFSIAALEELSREQNRNPSLIESIDVLLRPGKRVGRSLKTIREVPLKNAAQQLGLRIHERDTFKGWNVPPAESGKPINLIIAVSFGLFVPSRVLKSTQYGGLNVHPSLLPNYRGPAPLYHTILQGEEVTGITLQTMDDKSFDHGRILSQIQLPLPKSSYTYSDLLSLVKPKGATLLVQGLRDRLFVPPYTNIDVTQPENLIHAGKITPADREITWGEFSGPDVSRKFRALGRLWTDIHIDSTTQSSGGIKRAIFEDGELIEMPPILQEWMSSADFTKVSSRPKLEDINIGVDFFVFNHNGVRSNKPQMYLVDKDGKAIILVNEQDPKSSLRVREMTVAGMAKQPAALAMREFKGVKA